MRLIPNSWDMYMQCLRGPCKVRNETETERNETDRNETKQIETKLNETKQTIWLAIVDKNRYFLILEILSYIRNSFLILGNSFSDIRKWIFNIRNTYYFLILENDFIILENEFRFFTFRFFSFLFVTFLLVFFSFFFFPFLFVSFRFFPFLSLQVPLSYTTVLLFWIFLIPKMSKLLTESFSTLYGDHEIE